MVRMLSSICENSIHSLIGLNIWAIDYADVYKDREKNVSDARCEADSRGPGLPQGRHARARLPERGDDRHHPDLECECYSERYSDLHSTVQCKFAFIADARCE